MQPRAFLPTVLGMIPSTAVWKRKNRCLVINDGTKSVVAREFLRVVCTS